MDMGGGGCDLVVWQMSETKRPLGDYNTRHLQLRSPGGKLGMQKTKSADFFRSDVELDALQQDTSQKCVKVFYLEVQSAKPAAQTQ